MKKKVINILRIFAIIANIIFLAWFYYSANKEINTSPPIILIQIIFLVFLFPIINIFALTSDKFLFLGNRLKNIYFISGITLWIILAAITLCRMIDVLRLSSKISNIVGFVFGGSGFILIIMGVTKAISKFRNSK